MIDQVAKCIEEMRQANPHIHCITNNVAQNVTANIMLAVNVTPSMTIAENEIAQFANNADGILVNLGTMDAQRTKAIETILPTLKGDKAIWTLDPVMVHLSEERLKMAKKLVECQPSIIRCNGEEANALFGKEKYEGCLVISGKVDKVKEKENWATIENGHEWMNSVTAMGCALNAIICACATVEKNRMIASVAALVMFAVAGELAAEKSLGPGTFLPNFIDELHNMTTTKIIEKAKIKINEN